MRRNFFLRFAAQALWLLSACASTRGPALVANSHISYNKSVHQVVSEEILLNLVRRRYNEAPQFLSVSSLTSQIVNTVGGGVNASVGNAPQVGVQATGAINGTASFSDSPVITLTPRMGSTIQRELSSRIEPGAIAMMANNGNRLDSLLALIVEDLANVRGPQLGPGGDFRPGTTDYVEVIETVSHFIDQNQLVAGSWRWEQIYSDLPLKPESISIDNQLAAVALGEDKGRFRSFDGGKTFWLTNWTMYPGMWLADEARHSPLGKRLIERLNIEADPVRKIWIFAPAKVLYGADTTTLPDTPRFQIPVICRSFYSVMTFLSYGVDVPPEDVSEGRAFSTAAFEQAVSDRKAVSVKAMLNVHWSRRRPSNAFAAVRYRNQWFYVDDRDLESKRTFTTMYDLFNLQVAAPSGSTAPALTLPLK